MRHGPNYTMRFDYDDISGNPIIYVPLELEDDFAGSSAVRWTDNGDGTFTLKVFDLLVD